MLIKKMLPEHWEAVRKIYDLGIATQIATFEKNSPEWDIWDKTHLPHSRLVAIMDERVIGWAALSGVSDRCVYDGVAEISVYIHPSFKGMGIGLALLHDLAQESELNGIWTLTAKVFEQNKASARLHSKSGFRLVGHHEKLGKKNEEWINILLFEKRSKKTGIS